MTPGVSPGSFYRPALEVRIAYLGQEMWRQKSAFSGDA